MKYFIGYFFLFLTSLNAMNCSDYKDFQLFNGHYYSVSIDKLTFESAKQIAINNGGTLAIPNSQAENDFIKSLIGGGGIGWIGIHDPNKLQNYCYGSNCAYDSSRFRDVKNNSLIYKNFHSQQPDNLVKQYDVVDGKQMVSPLGEHWVAINGNNGQWLDFGNHADEYNNPVKYKAIFEFETLNECTPPTDDGVQELTGRFCNTKIWDTTIDTVTIGQTLDCQTDVNGNEYCPSALAQCSQSWDYDNGYSVSGVGSVTDYTNKVSSTTTIYSTPTLTLQVANASENGNSAGTFQNVTSYVMVSQNFGGISRQPKAIRINNNVLQVANASENGNSAGTFQNVTSYVVVSQDSGGILRQPKAIRINNNVLQVANASENGNSAGTFQNVTSYVMVGQNSGGISRQPKAIRVISTCTGGTLINGQCAITTTTLTCPNGYSPTTGAETSKGECKRTIEYTYYNYLCNNSQNTQGYNYTATNSGGNCNKTDPNKTTVNSTTLDDACNSSTPPTNNCKREKFLCQANEQRPCSYVDNKWQCSPFPCFGQSNLENLDTEVGSSDKNNDGWTEDGNCAGTIYIFNGKSNKCRSWDMFFGLTGGGCCDKDKVAAGLVACKENEKLLAKKREKKHTHYIGNFCSKKIKLGFVKICVQKSDGYCVFNSSLARILQEQGRPQLNISWGSAENPQCRGFTPEEFQKIDFSKIDLTEFVKDIQSSIQTSVIQNLSTYVKDKVEDFYGN